MPGLVEVLSGGVQFVQQLRDPRYQTLGVGVTHSAAAAAAAATAAASSAVAVGKGLAALDSLEQPGDGLYNSCLWFTLIALAKQIFAFVCNSLCENFDLQQLHFSKLQKCIKK